MFWYAIDVSFCNVFILQNRFLTCTGTGRSKLKQESSKHQKIEKLFFEEGNAGKHFCEKVNGRRKQCVRCKVVGINTPSGWAVETSFQCGSAGKLYVK